MSAEKLHLQIAASKAYYAGTPFLTNEEYDSLFGDSGPVGTGELGDIPHLRPMYSLQKHYLEDGEAPIKNHPLVVSKKFDGAAISLLFVDGVFLRALTRGDGIKGRDVTAKVAHLIPGEIEEKRVIQITGEVVAKNTVPNARNYASGALNLKSMDEFLGRLDEGDLRFIAYGLESQEGYLSETYTEDMNYLHSLGFDTVLANPFNEDYPVDGEVYRVDSNILFEEMGYTSKHPRGSYALKERDKPVVTILKGVVWQTGKSGKVTPVGILEPIKIDDATISRVTLNNMEFIKAMNLQIGCEVEVIRAGKIIPCIVGRAVRK